MVAGDNVEEITWNALSSQGPEERLARPQTNTNIHDELDWYECIIEGCTKHEREQLEVETVLGHVEHILIKDDNCKESSCYIHHRAAWIHDHTILGWR